MKKGLKHFVSTQQTNEKGLKLFCFNLATKMKKA
jgi:hypothetical protein